MNKNILILLFALLFSVEVSYSQDAGVRAYAGVTSSKNRVLAITPNGTSHTGYHFGADGRLNSGGMFFIVGLRYTSIDLLATAKADFFKNATKHTIFTPRFGFGWHLIEFGEGLSIRGKILGHFDFHGGYDEALLTVPYEEIVDATAGATLGLGLQLKFITVDVEYEYGFINVFREEKETKADALSLSLGFFF